MSDVRNRVRLFVAVICILGVACIARGMYPWHSSDGVQFACYLLLTAVASGLKVVLPGFEATVSVNFIFFLLAISNLSLSEALTVGVTATIVQCYWKATSHMKPLHFGFNLSQVVLAITAAYGTFSFLSNHVLHGRALIALLVSTLVYFVFNTVPVATVVAISERKPPLTKWVETYFWTFPYYLIGAAVAGVMQLLNNIAGWELSILVLPAIFAIYYSYRLYIGKLEESNKHLEEMASIHLRTVETLALAIEAKDHTTGDHLQRVRVYALELGKDLGLTLAETDALRAAAVLHDIGKLAVPEHIISKPGKLTPEEFDRMKVHPIVGAEICDQVKFPYPVVPIVRSHHEKWDGKGYPDGLAGEEIPIGSRILAAVDCLDALASDRQYRKALPLDEAMAKVEAESGRSFDPRVVAALKARYVELEKLAHAHQPEEKPKLSVDVKVTRGGAPAAGFAEPAKQVAIALNGSQQSAALVAEIMGVTAAEQSGSMNAEEALTVIAMQLRRTVAYDSMVVFAMRNDLLTPVFVLGENRRNLLTMRVPIGQGMAGWVASNRQSIVNGNPSVEWGYHPGSTPLQSAIAVPLEDGSKCIGVLSLYQRGQAAFSSSDLEILNGCRPELGRWINESHSSGNVQAAPVHSAVGPHPQMMGAD